MHLKDRTKLLVAGFALYRCSGTELVVKRQFTAGQSWRVVSRHATKKAIEAEHRRLLSGPKVIQI